jgi:hypothetical protein
MFSKYLAVFLWKKLKIKFLLASVKLFTNCENSSSNSLQEASSGFQVAAYMTLKVVPKVTCDIENCSKKAGYEMYN